MIAMHLTLTRQMPPAAGMMALLAIAVVFGAVSEIYLADILAYPMTWFDAVVYELQVMLASVLHLVGYYSELPWPTPQRFARAIDVGVFGGLLYVALEVFYVIAFVVAVTRQATQSAGNEHKAPKKLISLYLVLGLLYTFSFFYLSMFISGAASSYEMAFTMVFDAESLQNVILLGLPWKLAIFAPFQLALLIGLWTGQAWFKRAFLTYLLLDVLYYLVFTLITFQGYGIDVGLIISLLALLIFLPYLRKK